MTLADESLLYRSIADALSGAPLERGLERWDRHAPEPWRAWLVLCLARQLVRQAWLASVVKELRERAREGALNLWAGGDVPGVPGFRYAFHGRGCLLRSAGEQIDVDFIGDDEEGKAIDAYFFAARVLSLSDPPLPEARLRALLPTAELIARVIQELDPTGLLVPVEDYNVFRLCAPLEALAGRLGAVAFEDPAIREAFCVHLGDFEAASSAGAARATAAGEAYLAYLLSLLETGEDADLPLVLLSSMLSPDAFFEACARVIRGPIGGSTATAIALLDEHPELPACPAVEELLGRLSPDTHLPLATCAALAYLLQRGIARERALETLFAFGEVEVVQGFTGNPALHDVARMALEHAPERALPLVRRALRSGIPLVKYGARDMLKEIAEPWCQRELEQAEEEAKLEARDRKTPPRAR